MSNIEWEWNTDNTDEMDQQRLFVSIDFSFESRCRAKIE
jgi:hypothetical protein